MKKWQKQNKENQPITEQEWLKIFPEARPYVGSRLNFLKRQNLILKIRVELDLELINHFTRDSFSRWFWEYWLEITLGDRLEQVSKEINKLSYALYPPKVKKGQITDGMIRKAKEYPIIDLIENRQKMALCPFHNDKRPSLSLKNNYAYCFGCGYSADVIKFYMDFYLVDFKTAVKALQN